MACGNKLIYKSILPQILIVHCLYYHPTSPCMVLLPVNLRSGVCVHFHKMMCRWWTELLCLQKQIFYFLISISRASCKGRIECKWHSRGYTWPNVLCHNLLTFFKSIHKKHNTLLKCFHTPRQALYLSDDGLGSQDHLITVNIQKVQLPLPQQTEHQRLQALLKHINTHKHREKSCQIKPCLCGTDSCVWIKIFPTSWDQSRASPPPADP